jgi:hypothetical protein
MSRDELETVLVTDEHYDPSNVLRATRGLARNGRVIFRDDRHKSKAVVRLPPVIEPLDDSKIMEILNEIGVRG